jgi:hypothetical protein
MGTGKVPGPAEFVCVSFYPPISKRIRGGLEKSNSAKIRPLGRKQK